MDVKSVMEIEKEYTPKWNKNRGSKGEFKVLIQRLTPVQKAKCFYLGKGGEAETDLGEFVRCGATKILGTLNFNGRAIKTGDDICDTPGLDLLFGELSTEVITFNRTPDLKNS